MDTTLQVTARAGTGKGWARKARAAGQVPGVVYGPATQPQPVQLDPAPLLDIFKMTGNRNTIVQLSIDGGTATLPCLVREVQRHPVSRKLVHVDFYAVPTAEPIEVVVPLRTVGRPKGALLGGRLRLIRREVRAQCRYDQIPKAFEIDVTPLDIGDMVKASDLPLPTGVQLVFDHDFNVLTIYGKKKAPAAVDGEPAAAEEEV